MFNALYKGCKQVFFFNYNLQFIEQERRRTGGKVATAGRLSFIKIKIIKKKQKQKDASECKANFAASWAAELQDLLIQTNEQEKKKDSLVLFIYKYIHAYG